tara:strand:- start:165 stop:1184 length:1020 start_codon:yes stop_codon:yes gene_type:complete
MKVFVTGGCGFIGSNFILNELKKSTSILNYDKLTYAGNPDNLLALKNDANYTFYKGDICSKDTLNDVVNKFKPDVVVHFAAESHVDRSIENPLNFIDTNIVGTANLLNICYDYWKSTPNFKFIHISTDEVYGSLGKNGLFTEKSPFNPSSPYSASKASSDHLVNAWNKTFDFPSIITNCSNNYGPYQFPEKLIPLIITNCLDNKTLPVYGSGLNIRDWLYVTDHCEAISLVIKKGQIGETYNVGGNNEIQNIDIVNQICSILDKLSPSDKHSTYKSLIKHVDDRPGHDYRYAIDSSKIKKSLGWYPKESIKTGLLKTVEWYVDNTDWWKKIKNNKYIQN